MVESVFEITRHLSLLEIRKIVQKAPYIKLPAKFSNFSALRQTQSLRTFIYIYMICNVKQNDQTSLIVCNERNP